MAAQESFSDDITCVMLWVMPRSASTAFLKCMTNVPDTHAWFEPYLQSYHYSKYCLHRKDIYEFQRKYQQASVRDDDGHLRDIEGGYFASETPYSWIKEQLEASPPGKNMIFCKDLAWAVNGHYEDLPTGFHHTFLIRNPYLTFDSWKKVINRGIDDDKTFQLESLPVYYMPQGRFFTEQYDLYKYAKETLGQTPTVIGADELLANPAGIMKAYFGACGVPYKDEYLTWEPGNECMDTLWCVAKEQIYGQKLGNVWHGVTWKSRGFGSPRKVPAMDNLPDDVVGHAEWCMEYYLEMYNNRLRPL